MTVFLPQDGATTERDASHPCPQCGSTRARYRWEQGSSPTRFRLSRCCATCQSPLWDKEILFMQAPDPTDVIPERDGGPYGG